MRWWNFMSRGNAARKQSPSPPPAAASTPEQVGDFYDRTNEAFLRVYGPVIQAFRTRDVAALLDYQIASMGLAAGQHVLDAGCGVCGPAMYFCREANVQVQAVTVSAVQAAQAQQLIDAAGLSERIAVRRASYQNLASEFAAESFDVVYFLESFGHSDDIGQTLRSAWSVLKPGGTLYIKDLFRKVPAISEHRARIDAEILKINAAYHYNVPELGDFLQVLRRQGFILQFLKTIDLPLQDFENLTISNEFQELTGIGRIENWKDYIFPVDFFEAKCMKPVHDIQTGNSRYFLQNLYHLKVLQTPMEDL